MRILVTGGSGFLGSHIVEEAKSRDFIVTTFDVVPSQVIDASIPEYIGDVRDPTALDRAMQGSDAVINCAAIADLDLARRDPRSAIEVNILGTLSVMEAASRVGVPRILQASSVYVYSRSGSVYRTTKEAAEKILWDLSTDLNLDVTVLRFGSLYGPRADEENAIRRVVSQALNEGRIDFWGNGSEVREYVHVRDAASMAVNALDPKYAGDSVHIVGRERITTRELLETIVETLGGNIPITYQDKPFEGRYRLTPFSFQQDMGSRMIPASYIDLGLGLLEQIQIADQERDYP